MPCVKSGARAGSLYRNLVAHALTLGASGDRAPVRQQPCISVRFLSWECWDFWIRHDHFQRSPKTSEDVRSLLKAKLSNPSLRTRINASSLPVLFTSKIRDREEGIVIYSFYTWFSFLTWVWVNIFLEIVSSKTAATHIFQSGMRNWPASVSRREIEVFNPQAWELAGIQYYPCCRF